MGPFRLWLEPVVLISPPIAKNKNRPSRSVCVSGGSGWIRTSSGLSQQIYSLPRLSNSGARPILGAGSGNRTRISSLEGLHTSLCTMPATNSEPSDYIPNKNKIKPLFQIFPTPQIKEIKDNGIDTHKPETVVYRSYIRFRVYS